MMARSLRELREEVYDSASHLDENCSLIDEEYWYENDLVLAAELGKTLLERNRQLESQLLQSQKDTSDQQMEIDLLTKQLATLRELSENKMRIYEDVDKQCQELEKSNKQLMSESKLDKQRIQNLLEHSATVEARNDELRDQLERLQKEVGARERQDKEQRRLRKSTSVPSVPDALQLETWRVSPRALRRRSELSPGVDVDEVVRLHDKICELNFQVSSERRKKESLESELRLQVQENEELRSTVHALRSDLLALQTRAQQDEEQRVCPVCRVKTVPTTGDCAPPDDAEFEAGPPPASALGPGEPPGRAAAVVAAAGGGGEARTPTQDAVARDLFSGVEHDIEAVRGGEIGRLRTGGKVFSSRESLHRVGAAEGAEKSASRGEISLLAELDQQYNKLVQQYESLISSKQTPTSAAASTPTDATVPAPSGQPSALAPKADGVPTSPNTAASQFEKKLNAIFSEETRRQRKTMITPDYRPQYKQLFREAFSVLKDMKGRNRPLVPDS